MAKAQTAKNYTGALDGVESKVDANNFDPVHFTNTIDDSAPLRMTFQAKTRRQAEQWQARLRPKIAELVGGFPEKRAPLEAQTLKFRDFPTYHREKFTAVRLRLTFADLCLRFSFDHCPAQASDSKRHHPNTGVSEA